jgi:hypothetical protein
MTVGVVMTKIVVKKFRKDLVSAGFIVNDEKKCMGTYSKVRMARFHMGFTTG